MVHPPFLVFDSDIRIDGFQANFIANDQNIYGTERSLPERSSVIMES